MAATTHRLHSIPKQQTHMMTAKTNPWLDTVLSTEPTGSLGPKQYSKTKEPFQNAKSSDHVRPKSSTSKPKTAEKPAQSSLDEAFQAAVKAIVPERLEATRKAKAQIEQHSQGITRNSAKVTEFTSITSTNPTPTTQKLSKPIEKSLLQTAIEHVTLDRLHTVLFKALKESPKARSVFERELLVLSSTDSEDNEETIAAKTRIGRKRPRFEICRWCKEELDVTKNPDDACNHHTGELELKGRARQHPDGLKDAGGKRENCPDGSIWNCCRADGNDDGCKATAHEIDDDYDLRKPKRYRDV
jgi:hypothetical protein